jgi:citrate lyase subunit gamma (acyl carrier protein)
LEERGKNLCSRGITFSSRFLRGVLIGKNHVFIAAIIISTMTLRHTGKAGTDESSDIFIEITPSDTLTIVLESKVEKLYGKKIRDLIEKTLQDMGVSGAMVHARDKGALDYAIRARVKAAVRSGRGESDT